MKSTLPRHLIGAYREWVLLTLLCEDNEELTSGALLVRVYERGWQDHFDVQYQTRAADKALRELGARSQVERVPGSRKWRATGWGRDLYHEHLKGNPHINFTNPR